MDKEMISEKNLEPQASNLSKRKRVLLVLIILAGLTILSMTAYFFIFAKKSQNSTDQSSAPNSRGKLQPIIIFDYGGKTKKANFYLTTADSKQLETLISFSNPELINMDYETMTGPTGVYAISPDGKQFAYVVVEKIQKEQINNYKDTAFYNDPVYDAAFYESNCDSVNNLYLMNLETKEKKLISSRISYSGNMPITIGSIIWSKDSSKIIFSNGEIFTDISQNLTIEGDELIMVDLNNNQEQEFDFEILQKSQDWIKQTYVGSSLREGSLSGDYFAKECSSEAGESAYYFCVLKVSPHKAPVSSLCSGFVSSNEKWFIILGCDDNLKNEDGSFPVFVYGEDDKKFTEITNVRYAIGWIYASDKFIVMRNDGYLWIYDAGGDGKKLTDQKFDTSLILK